MPLELREPFFLRGRKSVLQRAVRISLTLVVLSIAAGIVAGMASVLLVRFSPSNASGHQANLLGLFGGTAAAALATIVGIPYFFWLGCSVRGIALRITWIIALAAGPLVFAGGLIWGLIQPTQSPGGLPGDMLAFGNLLLWAPVKDLFPHALLWLAWTTACRGRPRNWLLMTVVSGLGLPVWILAYNVAIQATSALHGVFPMTGFPRQLALGIAFRSSITAQFFALLTISWGLPFWWPHEQECPAEPTP